MESNNLREVYKGKRLSLSNEIVSEYSSKICDNVEALLVKIGGRADSFLCYYPTNNEVDIRELYSRLLDKGCKLYFPKTVGEDLQFYKISDMEKDFSLGHFKIMEPNGDLYLLSDFDTDGFICFTPGLVFDISCNRMGYGRGFYDRFFAENGDVVKIGLAYELQLSEDIVVHDKDIPLDFVVTEKMVYER